MNVHWLITSYKTVTAFLTTSTAQCFSEAGIHIETEAEAGACFWYCFCFIVNIGLNHSMNFSVVKKFVPDVDKLTLSAVDPVNISPSGVCTVARSGPRGVSST
jgi:hypothetical protein